MTLIRLKFLSASAFFGVLVSCKPAPEQKALDDGLCQITEVQTPIPVGGALMRPICDGVYAEPGLAEVQHVELKKFYKTARRNVASAFVTVRGAPPLTFFCLSASCKEHFGAPRAAAASDDLGFTRDGVQAEKMFIERPAVFVTGPVAGTARILTHEFVHAEMKAYVPYDALPTWFNEGLATMLANEPSCDAYPPSSSSFDVRRLTTKSAWQDHILNGATRETYCQARHVVSAWAEPFGDAAGVAVALQTVMNTVANGGAFDLGG